MIFLSQNDFKLISVRNMIQVTDSIPWVRCASGNVLYYIVLCIGWCSILYCVRHWWVFHCFLVLRWRHPRRLAHLLTIGKIATILYLFFSGKLHRNVSMNNTMEVCSRNYGHCWLDCYRIVHCACVPDQNIYITARK